MSIRPVRKLITSKPTLEGAGVHLRRAFGFGQTSDYDPFLLLDDFRSDVPEDYLAGFPWHPHRGIETITYVLAGTVEHGDSLGNRGAIAAGDIQWMTAGSGIIHQEMPKGDPAGRMHGFQLWANLPATLKMTRPRYQEIKATDIPVITDDDGTHVRLVCGHFWGNTGPVEGIAADPTYLAAPVRPGKQKTLPVETSSQGFAYVFRTARGTDRRGRLVAACDSSQRGRQPLPRIVRSRRRRYRQSWREWDPIPVGVRAAAAGASSVVWPDCHEYAGRTPASIRGTRARQLFEARAGGISLRT